MNILTIDVEEWFHLLDNESTKTEREWGSYESRIHSNMDRLFEVLERKKCKATFFCLGWIARKYPEIIKKVDALGYEIASHSGMHQLVYEQTRDIFMEDLQDSLRLLEDLSGKKVKAYRAPGFSLNQETGWVIEILVENGIERDCSIFPTKRAHGGCQGVEAAPFILSAGGYSIKEFPISIYNFLNLGLPFSGGGYFRVLPYFLNKFFFKHSNYIMTYFHPRDFDADQPMIKNLPFIRKLKSYYGLRSALKKFERLLSDFEFVDLQTANSMIKWETVKTIKL